MAKVNYGCGEVEAVASVYAAMLYEQEFGGADIINDLFFDSIDASGRVTERRFNAAFKAQWAMEKAANEAVPHYADWAKTRAGINAPELYKFAFGEVEAGFFRPLDTE